MKIVYQRVTEASVSIEGRLYSKIGQGVLILLAVEKGDDETILRWGADKIVDLRGFEDGEQKMNLSLEDIKGEVLVVSQFTLAGKVRKGRRPSFDNAELPEIAEKHYRFFCDCIRDRGIVVRTGEFGAMMDVSLVNSGPVTFIIEKV